MSRYLIFLVRLIWLSVALYGVNAQAAPSSKDTTPDAFSFTDQTGVALNTSITSNAITLSGINSGSSISISGGQYSRNNGSFTSSKGTAYNGDSIRVRHTSSTSYNATINTVLTIGGIKDTFSSTTLANVPSDTTPDAFSFTAQTDVALNSPITSNTITVSGIDAASPISISGGLYSINNGSFTSSAGTVVNGNTVKIQLQSSNANSTTTTATLSIGGVSGAFSVTTLAAVADTTPDAFGFAAQTNVESATTITSNAITVSGINAPAAISISGGLYSLNGATFVATAGQVNNGDSARVQQISSPEYSVTSTATLNIGGINGPFSVTTKANSNGNFLLPPASSGDPAFTSEHFSGSANCTMCHNNIQDSTGKDVSIETDWSSTMMANSARDPFWKAKVRSELNRNPHLADVINDKCTRCHAPMANFEAKKFNEPKGILDGGFLSAGHPRHDEAMNGVGCTSCHQIQDAANLGTLSSFTGGYQIGDNKIIYGQYTDPFANPMVMNTGYTPAYGAHMESSKICGTCHNLKTPFVDETGKILSTTPETEFPEQMPYSEWEHSSYATPNVNKQCQDCHMTHLDNVKISNRPMWLAGRDNFGLHEFVGANKLMLDIFDKNKNQLGVLANNFAETIDKTQTMLNSSASITPVSQTLASDNNLNFTLKINSNTGHKLPSAYPSRRVVLHVTVKDAQNNIVFESGKINANGSIVGVDADTNRTTFEPHYELITAPDQVQVYEAIMGDNLNQVTYTLLRGMVYLKDNRLLPQGFNKAAAPNDIKVVGDALTDANFVGGSDDISYRISGLTGNNYQVEAELVHQPIAYSFAQDLFVESDAEVEDFKTMFNASNAKTSRIANSSFSVTR
ncbi:MAG: multiheme c-type cytochrome [Methylobacter sp.]|nr:multiheme c-type cytochrome [Methylobacter sp.]